MLMERRKGKGEAVVQTVDGLEVVKVEDDYVAEFVELWWWNVRKEWWNYDDGLYYVYFVYFVYMGYVKEEIIINYW